MSENTKRSSSRLVTFKNPRSFVSEEFKTIRSNIMFSMIDKDMKSIMITSSGPGEGKSFFSANIAVSMAAQGQEVLLVDADLRRPTINEFFNIPNSGRLKGLTTLLSQAHPDVEDSIHPSAQEQLSVLPSGPLPPNPSELLASSRMDRLIEKLEERYDLIIFDLPPIVTVTDAQVMAGKTDGTIFVSRYGVSDRTNMIKAKQLLEHANATVLGTVFNGKKRSKVSNQYYYH